MSRCHPGTKSCGGETTCKRPVGPHNLLPHGGIYYMLNASEMEDALKYLLQVFAMKNLASFPPVVLQTCLKDGRKMQAAAAKLVLFN